MSTPTGTTETERKAAAKELLLADHGYFSQLFLRNEQIGETRVNWFIGIVTGAAGGLFALNTKSGLPGGREPPGHHRGADCLAIVWSSHSVQNNSAQPNY